MSSKRKTIVVSAVSLRKGGTLTILQDCLCYLSALAADGNYRVIALVHKRELADYPHIEYIEMPDVIKGWGRRLWCEYVTMYKLSQKIMPVYLWLSLHDATPRVVAERRVVYCQTSFPFINGVGGIFCLTIRLFYLLYLPVGFIGSMCIGILT